jgi:hypothetical protein
MVKNDKKAPAKNTGELKGYCMTCRDTRSMKNGKLQKITKGGTTRYMMRGTCEKCGGIMCKFVAKP